MSSSVVLLPRTCAGCRDVVPFAVSASADAYYVGWICPRCLDDDDNEGVLDVVGVHATLEDAEWDFLTEEYYASL